MKQVVQVNIDGKMVPLTNPDTKMPLLYADFLTDRSGPKFGGYLNETSGTEYLDGNVGAQKLALLIKSQKIKVREYCIANNLSIPDEEVLNEALTVFFRKHQTQRKLSDYDLTARETNLLERAIQFEVEKKLTANQVQQLSKNPKLAASIGKTAWKIGGIIKTELIIDYLEAESPKDITYFQRVQRDMTSPHESGYIAPGEEGYDPERAFTHMLIDGIGKTIREEYISLYQHLGESDLVDERESSAVPDTAYGLGISFIEACVERIEPDGRIVLTDDIEEIGDIICDNSSIFGKLFDTKNNFIAACNKLKELHVTEKDIQNALAESTKPGMSQSQVYTETLRYLIHDPSLDINLKAAREQVFNHFNNQQQFTESALVMEECAKKESQSQHFKEEQNLGKLAGNISDIGPFVFGVSKKTSRSLDKLHTDAKAHQQIMILTCLISMTRWGINISNYEQVGDTHEILTPEFFTNSINQRSYKAIQSTGIRQHLKFSDISHEESIRRLSVYQAGLSPIWQAIKKNGVFFDLVNHYRETKLALINANQKEDPSVQAEMRAIFNHARDNLEVHLSEIIQRQMPELLSKINEYTPALSLKEITSTIMDKLEESINFGHNRTLRSMKRLENSMGSQEDLSILAASTSTSSCDTTAAQYRRTLQSERGVNETTDDLILKGNEMI